MGIEFKEFSLGDLTTAASIIICVLLAVIIIGSIIACIILKKNGRGMVVTTKDITYGAICLAASFALSFIGFTLPQGGTITPASTLPIMIYCYYFGARKSAVIVTAYTLMQFLQSPYIVHPMSAVLDYVIPYMSLIFVGIFGYKHSRYNKVIAAKKPDIAAHYNFFIGVGIYVIIRYLSHFLSGVIFYGAFAGATPVVAYALAYNTFAIIDGAIAIACAFGLLCSKTFNRFMASSANTLKNSYTGAKNNQRA